MSDTSLPSLSQLPQRTSPPDMEKVGKEIISMRENMPDDIQNLGMTLFDAELKHFCHTILPILDQFLQSDAGQQYECKAWINKFFIIYADMMRKDTDVQSKIIQTNSIYEKMSLCTGMKFRKVEDDQ